MPDDEPADPQPEPAGRWNLPGVVFRLGWVPPERRAAVRRRARFYSMPWLVPTRSWPDANADEDPLP